MSHQKVSGGHPIDGNEAVAHVAYRVNDVIVIYPITPSSPMAEFADLWASEGRPNIWGATPSVVQMQGEGGAAGTVHGALQTGSLTTTFTASQGLLLMIPNMYKIAGELTPTVFHVAARTVATQALSIFGDHSDVMAVRQAGWAMLCSNSVQEAMDLGLISQAATLESRIPFLHFFDGFRTSHEVSKTEVISDEIIRAMINPDLVWAHRGRALSPDHPVLRGTAQNPDVHFQARETVNPRYAACAGIVQAAMDRFAALTGRQYRLYEYHGAPDAERVIVMMGSGAEAVHETVDALTGKGEKVGVLKVRLFRPFDGAALAAALPRTTRSIAVLDRTKEPGSLGEPLYLDVLAALHEVTSSGDSPFGTFPKIIGGRYGLSSKEFTPAMAKAVFDQLSSPRPKNHFTIGINDDVGGTSLPYDESFSSESPRCHRALFYGLGSDGTVGANKNTIKIISDNTDYFAQGYFVYDSKKAGSVTVSHLRFGPDRIRSSYLITDAQFIGCHHTSFLDHYDMLRHLSEGGTFLINTPVSSERVWDELPGPVQEQLIRKKARVFAIDAYKVATDCGLGRRINTIMQVCYFSISGPLPKEVALEQIKHAIEKTYGKKGEELVGMNLRAVDQTLAELHEIPLPARATSQRGWHPALVGDVPAFVEDVLGEIVSGRGDALPVSAFPEDGTYPTGTTKYEKRNLAQEIPEWDSKVCIQCAKCAIVCPHSVIRMKVFDPAKLEGAPEGFKATHAMDPGWKGRQFTLQVSPDDCTGCGICVAVCPARNKSEPRFKAINMKPQPAVIDQGRKDWGFFLTLPEVPRSELKLDRIRQQQMQEPLFEFSSACPGCGETPYLKLLSQLFGERALIANATGCSSIYGGNLPTTPWTKNAEGRGPAWANSLFEDNAEFGMGYRVSLDNKRAYAEVLLEKLGAHLDAALVTALLQSPQKEEADIADQRARVAALIERLDQLDLPEARELKTVAQALVKKSVWIVGGDGWAYDIGFGGLDHVIASGRNVNILILDTEVYSNTGGQMSKSTPKGAVAKFAAGGKATKKKDLGLIAMTYENVYVGAVAMGARDEHTLKTFLEAEAYDGPSVIIAFSHCVAHGIDMSKGMGVQKSAVDSGHWLLYRFNPDKIARGENPLTLDSGKPRLPLKEYMYQQNRFKMLTKTNPDAAEVLLNEAQAGVRSRWAYYEFLASRSGAPKVEAPGDVPGTGN